MEIPQVLHLELHIDNLGTGSVVVASGTKTIYHNSDGTATLSVSWSVGLTNASTRVGGSEIWTLDTIPRQAIITTSPDFNDEDNPTLQYSNPAGNSVNTLQACISLDGSNDDIAYRDISKTSTSYTFELTTAERNILRTATNTSNSRTVKYIIKTIIGNNTYYSEQTQTFTIINANPTFNDFVYQDTNTDVVAVTDNNQILVKGLSTLQVTIDSANKMIANKEATAQNYTAIIDSNTDTQAYSSSDTVNMNLGTINSAGTKRLTVRAYDSRNNSTEVYKDITVLEYIKPVINASITRLNNFESATTIQVNGTYSSLNINNIDKNIIETAQYRYREVNGTWGIWTDFAKTVSNGTYTCTDVVLNLDNTKAFEIEIQVIDTLNQTTTLAYTVDVGQAIFFISSNLKQCYINGKRVLIEDDLEDTTLTGTPTAPTAPTGTDTTQIATTEFVNNEIENKVPKNIIYVGSQVIYNGKSGNGIVSKTGIACNYNYGLIDSVFIGTTCPTGYHKEYKITTMGATADNTFINLYLNNISLIQITTWSYLEFKRMFSSTLFKESDIVLEPPYLYPSQGTNGCNLKYEVTGVNTTWEFLNVTVDGYYVPD